MTVFGYARASISQPSLDPQVDILATHGVSAEHLFTDALTGRRAERSGLQALQGAVRSGDMVLVTRLDRLGRDLNELIELIRHFDAAGVSLRAEPKTLLEVAQTISLISTLNEREQDPNVVTLSTLHAAKGLEWPHVVLAGVNEGLLPFRPDEDAGAAVQAARIEEERRLMYVGITRAQHTMAVSWARRRKKGREVVAAQPSRFIAEMALDAATAREDPREKLKALRAEFARRAVESQTAKPQEASG